VAADPTMRVQRVIAPVREQVAANLRAAIAEQRFKPGDRLVERELCELTGASRTSVREALRQLETEGLVSTSTRGSVVASVSPEEARQLYEVRAALEGLAGQRFAELATPEQLNRLREAVSVIEATTSDPHALLRAKDDFYAVLLEGAGNPVIASMLGLLHARVSVLRGTSLAQPGRPVQTIQEMKDILAAVERGDADAARDACRTHVVNAARTAIGALDASTASGDGRPAS